MQLFFKNLDITQQSQTLWTVERRWILRDRGTLPVQGAEPVLTSNINKVERSGARQGSWHSTFLLPWSQQVQWGGKPPSSLPSGTQDNVALNLPSFFPSTSDGSIEVSFYSCPIASGVSKHPLSSLLGLIRVQPTAEFIPPTWRQEDGTDWCPTFTKKV